MKEKEVIPNGLYIVDDRYFADVNEPRLMDNKGNSRPNFFAIKDNDGIFWMIPLSTQVENYRKKQNIEEKKHGVGNCVFYAFAKIAGVERVFLIGDIFPVTPEYIMRPYKISGIPYIVKDAKAIFEINKKAKKYLAMLKNGAQKSPANVLEIKRRLLTKC